MYKNNRIAKKIGLPRLLIIGCGDIGLRLLPLLCQRFRVFAVTSHAARVDALRAAGAIPLVADLDQPESLARLAGLARTIVHLAPPRPDGLKDRRTRHLIGILTQRATLVYISTSGVYGDCDGDLVNETRPVRPQNQRAMRRRDAEQALRDWARRTGSRLAILRTPGIYAADRLPLERLRNGAPVLAAQDDIYTNHIHADDLAHLIALAVFRAQPGRIYHAVDDSDMKMGDYFDLLADAFGLPKPLRLPVAELRSAVSPLQWSFMSESRRLTNTRMKNELGMRLRYHHVRDAIQAGRS